MLPVFMSVLIMSAWISYEMGPNTCGHRVGITTRLEERKKEWERVYPDLHNWEVIRKCDTQDECQRYEDELCKELKADCYRGGRNVIDKPWYVYRFSYCGGWYKK